MSPNEFCDQSMNIQHVFFLHFDLKVLYIDGCKKKIPMEINFDVKFCKSTTYAAEDCIDLLIIFDGDFIKIIARIWPAITIILLKICYHACSQDYTYRLITCYSNF